MGNYEYATTIGSGTVPHVQTGPAHGLTQGVAPIPSQRDSLRTRRGDGTVILNPEDFSVNVGLVSQAVTVGGSATPLPASPQEFRRALVVHNNSAITIFLGDSTVTTSTGLPVAAGEKISFDIQGNPNVVIYAVSGSSANVRIMELA